MNKVGRALFLLACVFSVLLPVAPAQAQSEKSPVGRWVADGYGFVIDFYVEPSSGSSYPVIGLVHGPVGGQVICPQNMPVLVERICEKVDKDGPFAIEGELSLASEPGQFVALYEGAFRSDWLGQDFPVRLAFFANELGRLQHLGTRRGRELPTSVEVTRTDEKPSPAAEWAEGNWQADFGSLRLEAAISADGPGSINGTLQAIPVQSGSHTLFNFPMLSNFHKVAETFYPFAMRMNAQLSGAGSLYEGTAATSADYTEIGQTARIRMLPFDGIAIVARIENLDGATFSPVFALTPLDGPLTPVPPPSGSQTAGEGETGPASAATASRGPAGEWRMVGQPHYGVPHLRVWRPEDPANGWALIPSTIEIESNGNRFTAAQPGWTFDSEQQANKANLQAFLANTIPATGGGSLDEWIGSPDDWLYSRHRTGGEDGELLFLISGDRALLLSSFGFRGLLDIFMLGSVPQNMFVAAFERTASPDAAGSAGAAPETEGTQTNGSGIAPGGAGTID